MSTALTDSSHVAHATHYTPTSESLAAGAMEHSQPQSYLEAGKNFFHNVIDRVKHFAKEYPLVALIMAVALVVLGICMVIPTFVTAIILGIVCLAGAGLLIYSLYDQKKEAVLSWFRHPQPPAATVTTAQVHAAGGARGSLPLESHAV